ncbi:MAG: PadR family transcriptional regulator [Bacteroidales bacterium]|nr:PadR family transcriptional regulator [Bacteroidales bacterium]
MKAEKNSIQLRKGVIEMCVLHLTLDDPKYTGDLLKELKEASLLVVEGTLYPLLNRLKDDELLEYYWEESTGGPPRKYYTCTPNGEKYLQELKKNWSELVNSVNGILQSK